MPALHPRGLLCLCGCGGKGHKRLAPQTPVCPDSVLHENHAVTRTRGGERDKLRPLPHSARWVVRRAQQHEFGRREERLQTAL
eukprot:scaffold85566_cov31-Tisochrysis_lutea.AAC.2